MKLYNTLTNKKELFSSGENKVKMYVCGITPYAESHLGHAMSSVIFDVIRRYLEFKGYEVTHIQNFTDIDDKMIYAASQLDKSPSELAEENINVYLNQMRKLNVLPAKSYPRATHDIPKIIEVIESLISNGFAYSIDGDVYFSVRQFKEYGKLSNRNLDNLIAGARVEIDEKKQDVLDFALWKHRKPNEPFWQSPWGPGRPGWHIECTAMAIDYLGKTIDIHGGGSDLIFPHHENEIAQSESWTKENPFAKFWVHNGLLQFGENKMSKSDGNIVTITEVLQKFSSDAIRLFFLSSHYHSPIVYNSESISAQERALLRLRTALNSRSETENNPLDPSPYRNRFIEAMDDDLNTPRALATLFELAKDINKLKEENCSVKQAQLVLMELANILGITLKNQTQKPETESSQYIQLLVNIRSDLRGIGQYDLADKIRIELSNVGITLEDTSQTTKWKKDPT